MNNNTLMIAAAGSGKTTYLAKKALSVNEGCALITTYTESNEQEIREKIIKKKGFIPSNITIQTWFSFLLQHGVRPYQSIMEDSLHEKNIGFYLINEPSAKKLDDDGNPILNKFSGMPICWAEQDSLLKHYFTSTLKIYSDKTSKFIITCNKKCKNEIIDRLSRLYSHFFIDEVQDLAGYDLEIIKSLCKGGSSVLLVGDPRQVTYQTHHARKHPKYTGGKINEFVENELGKKVVCKVDEDTLKTSHRNNELICSYSARLYPDLPVPSACGCKNCRNDITDHEGVFLVRKRDVNQYLGRYQPVQLCWNVKVKCNDAFPIRNMGESKGATMERVLIYPTDPMVKWIRNHNSKLKDEARAKFYVALTRARRSSAIIIDFTDDDQFEGLEKHIHR